MPSVTASTAAASLHSTTLMLYRPAAVSALLDTVSELAITNTAPSGKTTSEALICNSRGVVQKLSKVRMKSQDLHKNSRTTSKAQICTSRSVDLEAVRGILRSQLTQTGQPELR